jgi:hypothetical protein
MVRLASHVAWWLLVDFLSSAAYPSPVRKFQYKENGANARIATIIAMDMRAPAAEPERSKWFATLNSQLESTDVFVCTDSAYKEDTAYLRNVKSIDFVESPGEIPEGTNPRMIQWWRFARCWASLKKFTRQNNIDYQFIFKARTDVKMQKSFVQTYQQIITDYAKDTNALDNVAFLGSDRIFGGREPVMANIANFFTDYKSTFQDDLYTPINYNLLLKSDWRAGKVGCIRFPKSVLGALRKDDMLPPLVPHEASWSPAKLRQKIEESIDELNKKTTAPQEKDCTDLCHSCRGIHSEKDFLTYVLHKNMSFARIPTEFEIVRF